MTPADAGALAVLEAALRPLGFACHRLRFGEIGRTSSPAAAPAARIFCYAGHTDVVPPGEPRLDATIPSPAWCATACCIGRGACDMKGGIAAFVAGAGRLPRGQSGPPGSSVLLITGDEEGARQGRHGAGAGLDGRATGRSRTWRWSASRPSRRALGDTVKVGRRGSMNACITVHGTQGHSAYPQRADNPIHRLVPRSARADRRAARRRQPTSSSPPPCRSPASTSATPPPTSSRPRPRAMLNIRFNDLHTSATLTERLHAALARRGRPLRDARRLLRRELPDPARPLRGRAARARSLRGDRADADARHRRRHLGCALHRPLLPGGGARRGRRHHAQGG